MVNLGVFSVQETVDIYPNYHDQILRVWIIDVFIWLKSPLIYEGVPKSSWHNQEENDFFKN